MQAKELIRKCEEQARKNEYRASTVLGVKNLSRSDLDEIILYAENVETTGDVTHRGLYMKPHGNTREVLEKAGLM